MPLCKRIIPKLDIKGDNLVKGINLEGLRVLGKPEIFAKNYYDNGADELFYQDVVASLYGRNTLDDQIKKTAKEIFIPLTVGGGIRNIDDIARILTLGADKISINSAAINKPIFIKKAAETYGSSTIVVSIEAKLILNKYYAFTENGRNNSNKLLEDWIQQAQDYGAGEISITFIDHEGIGSGIDFGYLKKILNKIKIPVIINGGIGNKVHVLNLFKNKSISGVVISSMLHYALLRKLKFNSNNYTLGNIDFLENQKTNNNFEKIDIYKLKKYLKKNNIPINI